MQLETGIEQLKQETSATRERIKSLKTEYVNVQLSLSLLLLHTSPPLQPQSPNLSRPLLRCWVWPIGASYGALHVWLLLQLCECNHLSMTGALP